LAGAKLVRTIRGEGGEGEKKKEKGKGLSFFIGNVITGEKGGGGRRKGRGKKPSTTIISRFSI